jgi:outer membrane receptor for ferric coprogen and ferric-rhodotorulic acid
MTRHPAPTRSPVRKRLRPAPRNPALLALGTGLALAASAQTTPTDPTAPAKEARREPVVVDTVTVQGRKILGYTVDETSSATKLNLSPRETPQSMTVITRERLDDQNLTSLRQVLDNTPGVYSNAYDSERVLFYSRGFLVDTLMYDGVPALSNFNTGSIDETLDTALYDRIEIVRGATGLMTGAGNPAASINLVRKHADSRTPTISADLTFGSWNEKRVELDGTMPLSADGSIRARAVAVAEDTHSYQALYRKKTYVLYGVVDADLSASTRLSLGFDYQDNQPRSNTWGSFPLFLGNGQLANWPRSVTTATDWSYWNRKTQTVFGGLRHTFDNGWTLRSTLSHRRYDEDLALFYVFGYPDPATGLGLDGFAYRSRSTITENALDVYASGPFELLGRKHELVVGYNGSRATNTGTEQEPIGSGPDGALPQPGNFFEWNGSYPEPPFSPSVPLNDIKTTQDAVYAAARFSLADPLKLIAGARYDRWKVDSFYLYDTPENSNYSFSKVIPYAGLVWDILPQFSAFTSYTGIFKPQNNRNISGHYLDPVEGRSVEVGIKGEHFDRRLNTALTLFQTRQNNVAAPVYDTDGNPVVLPDGSNASQPTDVRTRGFEVEVAGKLTDELQGSFGWTRYVMQDGAGAPTRTFIPGTLVRLFATWEPKRLVPGLTLGGGVNWQSASSTLVAAPEGAAGRDEETGQVRLTEGSIAQLSLMARYQFSPKLSLQFNANNLLDRKYYVLDQYDNTYYGAPANYSVSLRVAY